jgi:hypothetical protein
MGTTEAEIRQATRLSLSAAREFTIHSLIGTFLFGIIAGLTVGINLLVVWLEKTEVHPSIIFGLTLAEGALFFADLFLFAVFIVRSVARTMKCL